MIELPKIAQDKTIQPTADVEVRTEGQLQPQLRGLQLLKGSAGYLVQ